MIVDLFSNLRFYKSMIQNLDNGLAAIDELEQLEVGRYEFDGGYFMVHKGTTVPIDEGTFEAHRKYIDIHIVMEGNEDVAWADLSMLRETVAYDEQKDAARYEGDADHWFHVSAGMCYVAYPHDGHKPVRHHDVPQPYTKIVMKLPVA